MRREDAQQQSLEFGREKDDFMLDPATPSKFKAPRPHPPTYEDDGTNHDYLEEDVDNFAPQSSNIDNLGGNANID
jgi:hypothetical protein